MKHFLITRFNVGKIDPTWVEHRFKVFEAFTLESLKAQTCKGFTWLIFYDGNTSQDFKDRLSLLVRNFPSEKVELVASSDPYFMRIDREMGGLVHENNVVAQAVRPLVSPGDERVITTRLDSDDAVHMEFIQRIQTVARQLDPSRFIVFKQGYIWHEGIVYPRSSYHNPFSSYLEPAERVRTVYCVNHGFVGQVAEVHVVKRWRAWLQVVHGKNVCNLLKRTGEGKWPERYLRGRFAFKRKMTGVI